MVVHVEQDNRCVCMNENGRTGKLLREGNVEPQNEVEEPPVHQRERETAPLRRVWLRLKFRSRSESEANSSLKKTPYCLLDTNPRPENDAKKDRKKEARSLNRHQPREDKDVPSKAAHCIPDYMPALSQEPGKLKGEKEEAINRVVYFVRAPGMSVIIVSLNRRDSVKQK